MTPQAATSRLARLLTAACRPVLGHASVRRAASFTFLAWLVALDSSRIAKQDNSAQPDADHAAPRIYDADGTSSRLDQTKDAQENDQPGSGRHLERHASFDDASVDKQHEHTQLYNDDHGITAVGSSTDPQFLFASPLPNTGIALNVAAVAASPSLGSGVQSGNLSASGAFANQVVVLPVEPINAAAPQQNTTAPTVPSVVASGSGIDGSGNGDLNAGHVVTLTVNMSEVVTVAGGIPTLSLNNGGIASYSGGSGSNALTFSYTVGAGQDINDLVVASFNLNGATVSDAAGNSANLAGAAANPAGILQIDTTAPTVPSVVASGSGIDGSGNGDLNAGHVVTLTVNMSEVVTVAGGIPTLSLNNGGIASYSGGSGSNALTFSYTVGAGQDINDLAVAAFNLNGATVSDAAGNSANLAGAVANPAGILQIDTTAPTVPSVVASGSGIDGSGNGDLNAGHVVTLTVNMSEVVTVAGGIPTLSLNDGGIASYSGGSGSNALTFSYTVGAGQDINDLVVASFNLNGATVSDAAGNSANLAGAAANPAGILQIDTTAPTVPSVVASGSGIDGSGNGDLNAGHVVTLTVNYE